MTWFEWDETAIGAMQTVTPRDGEDEVVLTKEQHIQRALGILRARAARDLRPTLVYFHWPHEDARNGELSEKLCLRVLNEENVARWGMLFRCVQIDMATSDEELTELLGAGSRPSFLVLDGEGEVVKRIRAPSSPSKMAKALEQALRKVDDAWDRLQETLDEQEKMLDDAHRLERADELADALERLDKVRFSRVRVGDAFDKAQAQGRRLAAQIEREGDD